LIPFLAKKNRNTNEQGVAKEKGKNTRNPSSTSKRGTIKSKNSGGKLKPKRSQEPCRKEKLGDRKNGEGAGARIAV